MLARCADMNLVGGACTQFLGAPPSQAPDRYQVADPAAHLPLGVRQVLVHGSADEVVPVFLSRDYVQEAQAAGDRVELVELPGGNHFTPIDVDGSGWSEVTSRVGALFA
jgi:pimeloyl-ACP methyl ester carboxylesterase